MIVVKGDQKAPFSIATTPNCWEGHYSFPWIALLYPWSVPYNAECLARRYQVSFFWVFGMARPGIETQYPAPLAKILPNLPMADICMYVYPQHKHTNVYMHLPTPLHEQCVYMCEYIYIYILWRHLRCNHYMQSEFKSWTRFAFHIMPAMGK